MSIIKKQKKTFDEHFVQQVIFQLLQTINYLHSNGIVHRNLSLNSILMKDSSTKPELNTDGKPLVNIKVSSFELCTHINPNNNTSKLNKACGEIHYVAPEMLGLGGYGNEVDVWAIGIIMFTLLTFYPPFYAQTKNAMIRKILKTPISVDKLKISNDGKNLLQSLLTKSTVTRIDCNDAINHKWFQMKDVGDIQDDKNEKDVKNIDFYKQLVVDIGKQTMLKKLNLNDYNVEENPGIVIYCLFYFMMDLKKNMMGNDITKITKQFVDEDPFEIVYKNWELLNGEKEKQKIIKEINEMLVGEENIGMECNVDDDRIDIRKIEKIWKSMVKGQQKVYVLKFFMFVGEELKNMNDIGIKEINNDKLKDIDAINKILNNGIGAAF
eukprot:550348_1